MAQIDSGLGWSCDEEFYVSDTITECGIDRYGRNYFKTSEGGAVIGAIDITVSQTFAILSTDPSYVELSEPYERTSTDIDGVIWYITIPMYGNNYDRATDFPYFTMTPFTATFTENDATRNAAVRTMLTAANVQFTTPTKDVPSVEHMHHYVEGVLKAMPEANVNSLTEEQLSALRALI